MTRSSGARFGPYEIQGACPDDGNDVLRVEAETGRQRHRRMGDYNLTTSSIRTGRPVSMLV